MSDPKFTIFLKFLLETYHEKMAFFETSVKIDFFECDPAGVLFFGNIFRLAHKVYEEFFHDGNYNEIFRNPRYAFPIVHTEADFFAPMRFGESYNAALDFELSGEKRYLVKIHFHNPDGGESARVTMVNAVVDIASGRSVKIPDEIISLFGSGGSD